MPLIRRRRNLFYLLHFIAPALDLMPCWQAWGTRDCNNCIKSKMRTINFCYEKKNVFPNTNVWPLFCCKPKANIVKILNIYIMLSCTHSYHSSFQYLFITYNAFIAFYNRRYEYLIGITRNKPTHRNLHTYGWYPVTVCSIRLKNGRDWNTQRGW